MTETMAAQISRAPLSTLMATKTMLVRAWNRWVCASTFSCRPI
ncbi:enoyl-CoA hydratase domain protein [Mycobacterium xenopi 3993]|nr:enoyl-CoA hydratase domain protein [Mycobacterium xenopi 3993]